MKALSRVGQGTWKLETASHAQALRALRRGVELGLTHIDTAEMYGSGKAEELVGAAVAGVRESVFLTSKVLPSNASYEGTLRACERSLKRLRTDHLDLYLLHWREADTVLAETFRAFKKLKQDGKILRFGVSNFDVRDLEECPSVFCDQVLYHLEDRGVEHAVLPWCRKRKAALVAYCPVGAGKFPADDKTLLDIAARHGVSAYAAALAFLLRDPSVFVIPKAARLEHVEKNAKALTLRLSEDDVRRLEERFPLGPAGPLPMV